MSEEKIIKQAEYIIKNGQAQIGSIAEDFIELYNLYTKEKTKNKELEGLEEEHKKENGELRERINELEEELKRQIETREITEKFVEEKFICKSEIKEKIEELKKEGDYRDIYNPLGRIHFMKEKTDYQIEVLQELLEESP